MNQRYLWMIEFKRTFDKEWRTNYDVVWDRESARILAFSMRQDDRAAKTRVVKFERSTAAGTKRG